MAALGTLQSDKALELDGSLRLAGIGRNGATAANNPFSHGWSLT